MSEDRYLSRKWILVKWGLLLYTAVHILNGLMILFARWLKLLGESSVEPLWSSSLTIWSAGVGAIILIYMGGNVADTMAENRRGDGSAGCVPGRSWVSLDGWVRHSTFWGCCGRWPLPWWRRV